MAAYDPQRRAYFRGYMRAWRGTPGIAPVSVRAVIRRARVERRRRMEQSFRTGIYGLLWAVFVGQPPEPLTLDLAETW